MRVSQSRKRAESVKRQAETNTKTNTRSIINEKKRIEAVATIDLTTVLNLTAGITLADPSQRPQVSVRVLVSMNENRDCMGLLSHMLFFSIRHWARDPEGAWMPIAAAVAAAAGVINQTHHLQVSCTSNTF